MCSSGSSSLWTPTEMTRKIFPVRTRNMLVAGLKFLSCEVALCQQSPMLPDAHPPPQPQQWKAEQGSGMSEYSQHHIMWIGPNYRSDEGATEFQPLMPDQKFKLAFDDSVDRTAFIVAGVFAGSAMAQGQYRSFGPAADRSLGKTANKGSQEISLDTAFNIMKEFWPDVRRKFFGR